MEEKRVYKCTKEQLQQRKENLESLIDIVDSKKKEDEKALEMCRIYNSVAKFKKAYYLIYKFGRKDPMFFSLLNRYEDVENFYLACEEKNMLNHVNYIIKIEEYLKNYSYAESMIQSYILNENSDQISHFLNKHHINKDIFDFCVETIWVINPILYETFLKKKNQNIAAKYQKTILAFEDISRGIKTGVFTDGTLFTLLEFWKRVPFKDREACREEFDNFQTINSSLKFDFRFSKRIKNFVWNTLPKEYHTITKYLEVNRMRDICYFKEEEIRSVQVTVRGRLITNEDNEQILNYMRKNQIPFIREAYVAVRNRYLEGTLEDVKNSKSYVKENNKLK